MNSSPSLTFPAAKAAFTFGLTEADLNLYGLPYSSQGELAQVWAAALQKEVTE
jgi:hypothetical protein